MPGDQGLTLDLSVGNDLARGVVKMHDHRQDLKLVHMYNRSRVLLPMDIEREALA